MSCIIRWYFMSRSPASTDVNASSFSWVYSSLRQRSQFQSPTPAVVNHWVARFGSGDEVHC